tara:strand:- start:1491 stop:2438 length:948 start_codon:yes stop_codon:yes gene_type:complete
MKDDNIPDLKHIQSLVNKNIIIKGGRSHTKASEDYIDVEFNYPKEKVSWSGAVPIEYRRTGVHAETEDQIAKLLDLTYDLMNPNKIPEWLKEQKRFWDESNKAVTRPIFEALTDFKWKCVYCEIPKNPNWARRFQDIKEFGYTTSTHTNMFCKKCDKNTTHLLLLPVPRGGQTGYETWSPKLRKRIMETLNYYDFYEERRNKSLLPDHKFSEIRWDENTKENNSDDMSEAEIKKKFQLLSNQRNQQKREVCRFCYQNNKRGCPFNIKFFYEGDEKWPENIPKKGKDAEKGCIGCGWYDLKEWKKKLNEFITSHQN